MNLLTILAIIICRGTFWVRADYYIEIKDWANPTSRIMDIFMYECKGVPEGRPAFLALESECTPIITYEQKMEIHATCTFYNVFQPDLQGHEINLSDRDISAYDEWNVGFSSAIDHPDFGGPRENDFGHFMARVGIIGGEPFILQPGEVHSLAFYFAQTNIIAYLDNPPLAFAHLRTFTIVLERIINEYGRINQIRHEVAAERARNRIRKVMKVALRKMVDPCTFLQDVFEPFAPEHCDTYCKFLNIAALNFGPIMNRCTSLTGGHCRSSVCTCVRASSSPFTGCQGSQMRMCNNALRVKLDL